MGRCPEEELGGGETCLVPSLPPGLGPGIWTLRKRPSGWKRKGMFYDRHGETLGSSDLSRFSSDVGGGRIWPVLCRDITHMTQLVHWRQQPGERPDNSWRGLCGAFEVLGEQVGEDPGKCNSFLEPCLYPQNNEAGKHPVPRTSKLNTTRNSSCVVM